MSTQKLKETLHNIQHPEHNIIGGVHKKCEGCAFNYGVVKTIMLIADFDARLAKHIGRDMGLSEDSIREICDDD